MASKTVQGCKATRTSAFIVREMRSHGRVLHRGLAWGAPTAQPVLLEPRELQWILPEVLMGTLSLG